jgi:subtilisin family serine protease
MDSKRSIFVAVAIIYFILVSNCIAASDNLPYKEGELLVRFAPKTKSIRRSVAERNQILSSFNAGRVKHSFKRVSGLTLVKLPKNLTVADALVKFRGKSGILYAEPNYKIKLTSVFPNDVRFDEQWALHNTGQAGGTPGADIDAPEAWNVITGSETIVAVIDTGVDCDHNDLAANMWINPGEDHPPLGVVGPEDFDGINDDNNYDSCGVSLIDDIYGWNFFDNNNDMNDYYGHGTYCAGIIGAVGNNNEGVTGVCWTAKIMVVKIVRDDANSETFISNGIEGIEYAVDNGAKVLSNSWTIGSSYSQTLKDAIDNAGEAGVLFIVGAGNGDGAEGSNIDIYPLYPSSYDCDNIICVLATTNSDARACYSNAGPISVDLGAPGGAGDSAESDILTTAPGGGYGSFLGTSAAAPHVAGACALVWAANPFLTHLEVKRAIIESVDKLDSLDGLCVSGGRLNLYNAVTYDFNSSDVTLTVTDNTDCTNPSFNGFDSLMNYTICCSAINCSVNDVNIVDYLPIDVDFNSASSGGLYDVNTRAVTWSVGDLDVNDTNCLTLTVRIAEDVIPGTYIANMTKMYSGPNLIRTAEERTKICCYDTIVYVDSNASGTGDGSSWQNAYNELRDALDNIKAGNHICAEQVWTAAGTYKPTNDANDSNATFEMLDGIALYGHFAGVETSTNERNLADANYATILSGDVDGNGDGDVNNVVTAADERLDGFTVEKGHNNLATGVGVLCNNCSPTIANCIITNNYRYGIYCQNGSNATITNTFINNNTYGISGDGIDDTVSINIDGCTIGPDNNYGLYVTQGCMINAKDSIFSGNNSYGIYVSTSDLTVERCSVNNNGSSGIYTSTSSSSYVSAVITDSIIHNNNNHGIYISAAGSLSCQIRNNTIADNGSFGIYKSGAAGPNISSNIIWDNTSGSLSGTFGSVNYNCIQSGFSGTGNIASDPCFIDADANDYHLSDDSNCIEAGDPNFVPEAGETDIDGEDRMMDGDRSGEAKVDMGADEFYHVLADIYPQPPDGIVNFLDFAVFAKSWRTSQGQPGYNDVCDFCDDGVIDYKDLYIFCCDWLWITIRE